jgi:sigma-E factor negative regulatory protein RseC
MIEESGRVIRTSGDSAWVQTERRSSCGSCSARKGCGTGALAGLFGARLHEVEVHNPIGARPGDEVIVGISESLLVRGSLALYLLPLLSLVAGALLGEGLAPQLGLRGGEAPAILGGVAGLAGGLLWLRWRTRRWPGDPAHMAVILRRVVPLAAAVNLLSGKSNAK